MVENGTTSSLDWGEIGEARWRELGKAAGASELQLRFAVARHAGATLGVAARLAGYSDSDGRKGAHRSAGYSALRSTAVQNLLELSAIEAPDEAAITDIEVAAKIAKLVRSPDPNVALKAIDLRAKHNDRCRPDEFDVDLSSLEETYLHILQSDEVVGFIIVAVMAFLGPAACIGPVERLLAPVVKHELPDLWRRALALKPELELHGARPVRPIKTIIADLAREVAKSVPHIPVSPEVSADASQQPCA